MTRFASTAGVAEGGLCAQRRSNQGSALVPRARIIKLQSDLLLKEAGRGSVKPE